MKISRRYFRSALVLLATVAVLAAICWMGSFLPFQPGSAEAKLNQSTEDLTQLPIAFDINNPKVQAVIAAQHRNTPHLLSQPEVVGTATGVDNADQPSLLVFTKRALAPGAIPESLDGIPVVVKVTGEILPMVVNYYDRPVPIGVSTGNAKECSAGTIGARVKDAAGKVYALSNNHVYALENLAPLGSRVLQPGLYDNSCKFNLSYVIGSLYDFEPISFSQDNIMDAAIATTTRQKLGTATPPDGYGRPRAATLEAFIGQRVQKYGRTTKRTIGTVTAINGIILVSYSEGTATFVNQIVVRSTTPFIKPGDSGSLLVTYPKRNPVGLLFAGNATGKLAVANPIDPVLQRFGVTIDGYLPPATSETSGTTGNTGGIAGGMAGN